MMTLNMSILPALVLPMAEFVCFLVTNFLSFVHLVFQFYEKFVRYWSSQINLNLTYLLVHQIRNDCLECFLDILLLLLLCTHVLTIPFD